MCKPGAPVGDADALDPAERHLHLGVPAVARVVRHLVGEVLQGDGEERREHRVGMAACSQCMLIDEECGVNGRF